MAIMERCRLQQLFASSHEAFGLTSERKDSCCGLGRNLCWAEMDRNRIYLSAASKAGGLDRLFDNRSAMTAVLGNLTEKAFLRDNKER